MKLTLAVGRISLREWRPRLIKDRRETTVSLLFPTGHYAEATLRR